MAFSNVIHANINDVSINLMLCSNEGLTKSTALYSSFERFHQLQRSLVWKEYNALKYEVNVRDATWKHISKWSL